MKQRQRLELWEVRNGAQRSVIGTCLAPADVKAALRKAKLERKAGAAEHEVHGFLVDEAARQGQVGRIIDAHLDRKYAGAIRQSLRLGGEEAILAYWQEACRRAAIAGPCWALLTLPDLPQELANRIFGDVYMLDHFMAGASREQQAELWAVEQRTKELAQRLQKVRRGRRSETWPSVPGSMSSNASRLWPGPPHRPRHDPWRRALMPKPGLRGDWRSGAAGWQVCASSSPGCCTTTAASRRM